MQGLMASLFSVAEPAHHVTLIILILLSIFSIAFILERWIAIKNMETKNSNAKKMIQESLQSNDLKEVSEYTRDKESLLGRGLAYGIRHAKQHGPEGLEEVFNTYALIEKPELEKRLNFLATVGSNAPFIGLLGTVFGIMNAFRGLADSQGDMTGVMAGISEALIATAVGLLVAIPAVIAYNFFQRKVKDAMHSLESAKDLCMAYAKTKKPGA